MSGPQRRRAARWAAALAATAVATAGALPAPAGAAPARTLTVLAGTGQSGTPAPGPAAEASFGSPYGVAPDGAGGAYLSDYAAMRVYRVDAAGTLTHVAGTGVDAAATPGPATASAVGRPQDLAVDGQGRLLIASYTNRQIYRVDPQTGQLSVLAGNGSAGACTAGPATGSPLGQIGEMAFDSNGNLYAAEATSGRICRIAADGTLSVFAGLASGGPADGDVSTVGFDVPLGLAVDADDNVYVADYTARKVARITQGGAVTIVAGNGTNGAAVPGPARQSPLYSPMALAVDSQGTVYVGQYYDPRIVAVADGVLGVVAGSGSTGTPTAGPATGSPFTLVRSLAAAEDDSILIADYSARRFMRLSGPLDPPGAPTGLQVSAGRAQVGVSFLPPADPGGSAIVRYEVSTDGGAHWATLATTAGAEGRRVGTVGGLVNGQTYQLAVRAVNADGPGAASATEPATPQADVPDAPTALTVTAGDAALRLRLTPPADDGGSPVTGYAASTDAGATWDTLTTEAAGDARVGTVAGLVNGQTYAVRVRAVNARGPGAHTASAYGTPGIPPAPTDVTAAAGVASLTVSWTPPATDIPVLGYRVTASPGPATCETTATSCVLGAQAGTPYTVRVRALAAADLTSVPSEPSAPVTPTAPAVPAAPPPADGDIEVLSGDTAAAAPGEEISLFGDGYAPHSTVVITVYSAPQALATVTADARGAFRTTVTLPQGLAAGDHTLVAAGVDPDGRPYALRTTVTVAAAEPGPPGQLPVTGPAGGLWWSMVALATAVGVAGTALVLVSGVRRSRRG
ncbi:MAG TPA: fibronectin type III domain-containing protein [Pilimelia sp.]|nr:fibronectin type III domain-containing protein [Pilimelia sp.]